MSKYFSKPVHKLEPETVKIIPLGGAAEVTKNMFIYQYGNDCLVVDCGFGFPNTSMLGVDFVIPDISYLIDNNLRVQAMVITHGHEDHIGAIPYIAPQLKAPIFATPITAGLIKSRLEDFPQLTNLKINVVSPKEQVMAGPFKVELVRVSHSVPDSVNLVIKTPVGTVYHGSDFKFDFTPVDNQPADVGKITSVGNENVLLLLSDCLRAEKAGFTPSERTVKETIAQVTATTGGKVLVTTASSNLSRIKQAIEVAIEQHRKVAFIGRSIVKTGEVARSLGYFSFPKDNFIDPEAIAKITDNRLMLIVAGSQGQPESALSQIANQQHRFVKVKSGDSVIFSADPIPGNVDDVHILIDNLTRLGAKVAYSDILDDLHVSGHAAANELMLLISLLRPKFVMPISGNHRQMAAYAQLAQKMGYGEQNIILTESGQIVELRPWQVKVAGKIELRNVMVDGLGVGDIGSVVLRDRQQIAADGFVVVIVPVNRNTGKVSGAPDIVSRGFVYMNRSKSLIAKAEAIVINCLNEQPGRITDWHFVRRHIGDNLEKFLYNETKRRPMILPVVIEV